MYTGFSSEIGTKLRDWAVGQAGGSCYSQAALSSNDSKTLYVPINLNLFGIDCPSKFGTSADLQQTSTRALSQTFFILPLLCKVDEQEE